MPKVVEEKVVALLAAHSVDEFVFSVPDQDVARHFYANFGLEVRDEGDALALYTKGHPHRWGRVYAGEEKRLLWLTIGFHAQDLPRLKQRLERLHIGLIQAPPRADDGGLWILGPDRLPIQLRVAEKTSPSAPAPRVMVGENANVGRSPSRGKAERVRPLYLSHILLFSSDVNAARDFYESVLGLRLSDRSGSTIAFMHSPHGSDHHLIALAKANGGGLHHTSWCVPSIDDVGLGMEQMVAAGYPHGWGVGRHVLGSNYFRYVRDPWGSYAEYSYDIDYVEQGSTWPAADHPLEDSLYVWGPALPKDFITNYEAPEAPAA